MTDMSSDLRALKATTSALIDACGGVVAASVILGKSQSLISAYGSMNEPGRTMPALDVLKLEKHAQAPIVSQFGVDRHRLDPERARHQLSPTDLVAMTKEESEAKLTMCEAFADGRLCAADRAKLGKELRDVIHLYQRLLEAVEDVA